MMPVFFHLQSHLWIAYLFLLNGLIIAYLCRHYSSQFRALTHPAEAMVLAGFFVSIGLNGLLLLMLQALGLRFSLMVLVLPLCSAISLLALIFLRPNKTVFLGFDWSFSRVVLYFIVFVILFYNGGLIEQISDAWWHMSLANKIGLANSFTPEVGHLDAMPTRYYPPLWHGNLALANLISGESLPVIWNSFTAWGAMFKVMAYYLFARALLGSKQLAVGSAILFVLLPGMGNSYLRVSAWPSHIAFTAMFVLFYLSFTTLNALPKTVAGVQEIKTTIVAHVGSLISFLFLALIVLFSHQAELFYFALAFLFFYLGLITVQNLRPAAYVAPDTDNWLIHGIGRALLLSATACSVWFLTQRTEAVFNHADLLIAYSLPAVVLIMFTILAWMNPTRRRQVKLGLLVMLMITVLATIDLQHLMSLFLPELAHPRGASHEAPLLATGWFGTNLALPGWHLQLRAGLLYSGIVALPLSIVLVYCRPTQATIFLAANAWLAFVMCCSPYMYHWLRELLAYHSPWRIAVLIFHPLIIALALQWSWKTFSARRASVNIHA